MNMNATRSNALLHEIVGKGAPIVLVPGGLSGWLSWIPFVQPLAKDRQVVRVQLRSIELVEAGKDFPTDYDTLSEREALRATVDHLGLSNFDLVGWSHGGHIALAFALEYPRRVRTLTVIEPPAFWILREVGYDRQALGQAEVLDRSWAGTEVTVDDLKEFLVRADLARPEDDFETIPGWPVWVRNRQVLSIIGTIWDYSDSLDRLRILEVPVLGVKGTDRTDQAVVVDHLVATVPRGRLLTLPGGHACHLQNMDRFLEELASHTGVASA
jgi:pimeloyl-ACP methyl ester carboxylesterase